MQILPATFDEIQQKSPFLSQGSLREPRWNIAAGIFYDRLLHKRWRNRHDRMPHPEDLQLTFASYNAGYRRMINIIENADYTDNDEEIYWSDIEPHAPAQTRHYVRRIRGLMGLGS
jgi:membrane-bound lytic murein transglycosylase F